MRKLVSSAGRLASSKYVALALRAYLGIIFITAAMGKLVYPAEFAANLAAYRIVPYWSVPFLALVVPWTELICGLFLIIGLMTRAASAILGALLLGFIVFISVNIFRGTPINCGCFDSVGEEVNWKKVFIDFIWMLMAAHIYYFDRILQIRRQRLRFGKRKG
jgi:uncharacterized membrane protein YphA (DoxX/SURF4 family)